MAWDLHVWLLTSLHIVVFLLGVPGNALIIRVFAKKQRKSSTHIFILGLAIADLYVCLATAALVAYWFFEYSIDNPWVCQGGYFSIVLGVYFSLFVTTVIAVERYYAVCRPLDKVVTPFRARLAMFLSVLAAVIVSAPSITFSDIVEGKKNNVTVYMCWPAPDDIVEWGSASGMYSVYVISLIMVAILYSKVYYTIRTKVLGPTLSTKPKASVKSKDTDTPVMIEEALPSTNIEVSPAGDFDNDVSSASISPARSNGSIHNGSINNGSIHNGSIHNGSIHNGSINNSIAEAIVVKEADTPVDESPPDVIPSNAGSTEVLIPEIDPASENQHVYSNDAAGKETDDEEAANDGDSKPIADLVKDTTSATDPVVDSEQVHPDKAADEPAQQQETDGELLHPVTNGVSNNNSLTVTPANTASSSPASSPKKDAMVVNTTAASMAMVPMVKTLVPIKYDDEYNDENDGNTNTKRNKKTPTKRPQQSMMSFRGFLRRPMSWSKGSFNSQASTRSLASQRMQNKTTNMLLLVTIVTYVTWIPTLISSVILVDTPDIRDQKYSEALISILLLMKFLFVLNHAANPFIYTVVNDRFRSDCVKEIRLMFGCTQKHRI